MSIPQVINKHYFQQLSSLKEILLATETEHLFIKWEEAIQETESYSREGLYIVKRLYKKLHPIVARGCCGEAP